jgi:hypothetical protein
LYVLAWAWIIATAVGVVWGIVYLIDECVDAWREYR